MPKALITTGLLVFVLLVGLTGMPAPALPGTANIPTPLGYLPLVARGGPTSAATNAPSNTAPPSSTSTPISTPEGPCIAVYPIAIGSFLLDENGFVPPSNPAELPYYLIYNDATYTNKTQRRVYQDTHFTLDRYDFLAWTSSVSGGSAATLTAALSGTGTLAQGFDEVTPWPDPNSTSPTGYPLYPHQINPGDWLRVNNGTANSAGTTAALTAHVDQKRVMSLPIIDEKVGTGQLTSAHHVRMGNFLLRGFSLGGATPYLDLVYLEATLPQYPPFPFCP